MASLSSLESTTSSEITSRALTTAIRKTNNSTTGALKPVIRCPAGNKRCSSKDNVNDKQPKTILGDFDWKMCMECKAVKMARCCNEDCLTNDEAKRQMSDDIQTIEQENRKFTYSDGKVVCLLCGAFQPQLEDFKVANLDNEDESGNRFFDDEGAQSHHISYGETTRVHKHQSYLIESREHKNNKELAKNYIKHKRKLNHPSHEHDSDNNSNSITPLSSTSASSSSSSASSSSSSDIVNINEFNKALSKMAERSDLFDEIYATEDQVVIGNEHITDEMAIKAIHANMNGPLRTEYEFKLMEEMQTILHTLEEGGLSNLTQLMTKDASLAVKAAKFAANIHEYMLIVLKYKSAPTSRSLRKALAITNIFCKSYPQIFVSYQSIFDACHSYEHIQEDIEESTKTDDQEDAIEDKKIKMKKYLSTCQELDIYYSITDILSTNFLTSAGMYLINKFMVYTNSKFPNPDQANKQISNENRQTLIKRMTDQVKLYMDMVHIPSVAIEFTQPKTKKSKTSNKETKHGTSLDLSIKIPAILLIMACERLHKPCKYQITGQVMAKLIQTSDSSLSNIKDMILKEKPKVVDSAIDEKLASWQDASPGLHKKKQAWVLNI